MRTQIFTALSLCLTGLATAPAVPAQTPDTTTPAPATSIPVATPARGQSMAQVESQFGAPTERFAAVGQPPITRWVYADKVVYFEYDHVVHAVALRH